MTKEEDLVLVPATNGESIGVLPPTARLNRSIYSLVAIFYLQATPTTIGCTECRFVVLQSSKSSLIKRNRFLNPVTFSYTLNQDFFRIFAQLKTQK